MGAITRALWCVSPEIRLCELSRSHRDRVAEILESSRLFRNDEVLVALELFDASLGVDTGVRDVDYAFVGAADADDRLIGFACYGPTPDTDRTYDLYWIAVDAACHSAGIGTTLLAEAEKRLRREAARLVVVETSSRPDYEGTRGFYLRRGYVEAARVADYYGPSDGRVIFTKRLQPEKRQRLVAHGAVSQ